mmetsp:Transcript_247/g.562  ORF Transcript_247/g.562 Transcript_247/m.562 type:complete len:763 (-) Transcript_247:204-2492(-)|eukprot:CAMPEP_0206592880 /NCGR_PEP_ID=MMETSP0325_2-20121206/41252_1 /ASSEMBLY_ACC=CAM_ASM_000347 /TAXON_ID=2866 /ORGANISM="Crypthecodinium cohnii, Strain Seligo" /LENGTH=762 /DNA_ID=CAMNT_0054102655 /DNA_START=62 /DNA_END=2350 /DNA_ORIENTATION=-
MAKKAEAKREMGKRKVRNGAANRGHTKGQGALKAGSAFTNSNSSAKVGRTAPNGEKRVKEKGVHYRTESTIKRLNMYKKKVDKHKMKEQPTGPARIQPDRRWFGNTRVITQEKMQAFRETMSKGVTDPFSVVLKSSKLPMSLLKDTEGKASRMDLLSIQPYQEVFSKKKQQKRVKLGSYDLESLVESADSRGGGYDTKKDTQLQMDLLTGHPLEGTTEGFVLEKHGREEIFNKGTSRRIWAELYKVVDASDVICFILDARDPMGTRCMALEREIRKHKSHKHIVLVLNKVDLVPTWVSRRWIQILMKDFPTLAFHASITNPFGKNALLNLLRQFSTLLSDKKHVTVGMIGYPNVGKSSVINTLKRKKVCKAAPVPGETRIWQYIALTRRLYLLDCPGIVPPTASDFKNDAAKVLKGVVRAERVEGCSWYIDEVLSRVKKQYLIQRYKLDADTEWEDGEGFLTILANKMGKLFKGGDPDLDTTARIVLYDWQRGRIPFFTMPPDENAAEETKTAADAQVPAADEFDAAASAKQDGEENSEAAAAAAEAAVKEAAAAAAAEDGDGDEEDEEAEGSEEEGDENEAGVDGEGVVGQGESSVVKGTDGKLVVKVDQSASFSKLACSLAFDEEDRQGEAAPAGAAEDDNNNEEGGGAGAGGGPEGGAAASSSSTSKTGGKAGGKGKNKGGGTRKQQKQAKKLQEKRRAAEGGDADDRASKKRRRRDNNTGKGGSAPSGGGGGEGPPSDNNLVRPGCMDWGAVMAEFGM